MFFRSDEKKQVVTKSRAEQLREGSRVLIEHRDCQVAQASFALDLVKGPQEHYELLELGGGESPTCLLKHDTCDRSEAGQIYGPGNGSTDYDPYRGIPDLDGQQSALRRILRGLVAARDLAAVSTAVTRFELAVGAGDSRLAEARVTLIEGFAWPLSRQLGRIGSEQANLDRGFAKAEKRRQARIAADIEAERVKKIEAEAAAVANAEMLRESEANLAAIYRARAEMFELAKQAEQERLRKIAEQEAAEAW